MAKPQVIFLDAVGTLFGVRGSVGQIYSAIAAQEFGVTTDPTAVNAAFYECFAQAPPLAFPGLTLQEIPEREYAWWATLAEQTFAHPQVDAIAQFTDFGAYFARLYGYFALPDAWVVYPDILPTLEKWQQEGVELGIISNFDTRLYTVLDALDLYDFFETITLSSVAGSAKPEADIFQVALNKHGCAPGQAWHIGDSVENDYKGAKAAGLRPFLIKRS